MEKVRILLVEDNPGDARLIREMLAGQVSLGMTSEVMQASSLGEAAEKLAAEPIDVVLLDLNLPDSTGLHTVSALQKLDTRMPVIVLTGAADTELSIEAVRYGVQDYISKNENNPQLLMRVIHYAIERKRTETALEHMATHDPLTGLPNRTLLFDRLDQAVGRAHRKMYGDGETKSKIAVMVCDLDGFKRINDEFGHDTGDRALQSVARRMESCLRACDTVARLGGDEFVVIAEGVAGRRDCEEIVSKIVRTLKDPPILDGRAGELEISFGIGFFPDDAEDVRALLRCADRAMYAAKRRGVWLAFCKTEDRL